LSFAVFQEQYSKYEGSGYYYLFHGAPEMVFSAGCYIDGSAPVILNEEIDVIKKLT